MTTPVERTRALLRVPELVDALVQAKTKAERRRIAAHLLRHYPTPTEIYMVANGRTVDHSGGFPLRLFDSDEAARWKRGD